MILANMDGSLRKPNNSTLLKELEMGNLPQSTIPVRNRGQSAYIVDTIQMLSKGKMITFGELSDTIAAVILAKLHFARHVQSMLFQTDMVWKTPSNQEKDQDKVQSRETTLPVSLKPVTCQVKKTNKSNLLSFLYADWCEKLPLELKDNETIILASQDGSAVKVTSMLNGEDIILLNLDHEKADSRIFEHCEYFNLQTRY